MRFSKMQALGNDFVVIDAVRQDPRLDETRIRLLADRHFGVGADQVLLVEPVPDDDEADFFYRIYNADGSEAGQCGNGARCLAHFIRREGLSQADRLILRTRSGRLAVDVDEGGLLFDVEMGVPRLAPADVPFLAEAGDEVHRLELGDETVEFGVVSVGNPHAVLVVDDVTQAPVARLGPRVSHDEHFPERCNVGFMEVVDRCHIRLRVYERGAGETLACGSGACAAVISGRRRGLLDERVSVELPGGSLLVAWPGQGRPVHLIGTAVHVFEGRLEF